MLHHDPTMWALAWVPDWAMSAVGEPGIISASSLVLLSAFQGGHCGLTSAPSTVSSRTVLIQTPFKPSSTTAQRMVWETPRVAAKYPSSLFGQTVASQAL